MAIQSYLNNPKLKAAGVQIEFTQENIVEWAKCKKSPIYFIENYAKLVSLDRGIVLMKLYPYQKRLIKAIHNNRNTIAKLFRQAGKSQCVAAYMAWYCIFNDNKTACILANKMAISREIFSRLQFIIEELPKWLQQGVQEWNKTSFELENGTRCFCAASSPSAIRGTSINFLMCDEFAFLAPNLADEFIASVFPTLSSSKKSKMVIVSTPRGLNHYWKLWTEAEQGLNDFVPVEGKWQEHPDRDQAWADGMLTKLGSVRYAQEISCQFHGSSATLIKGELIPAIAYSTPTILLPNLHQFQKPVEGHQYVMLVDTSRGSGLDHSAFVIVDISTLPYQVVVTYYDNKISTLVFPELIWKVAIQYNQAFVLIETNDLGQQVADTLYYDLEYENVYMSHREEIKEGGGAAFNPGCRTTKRTKAVGCDRLKGLIENDKILINDVRIINEMSTFVRVGPTYKAEDGKHDDLMMCLVMFGFLTSTDTFADLFDFHLRKKLVENQLSQLEDQMLPIGFVTRSETETTEVIVERVGDDLWIGNANIDQFMSAFN